MVSIGGLLLEQFDPMQPKLLPKLSHSNDISLTVTIWAASGSQAVVSL